MLLNENKKKYVSVMRAINPKTGCKDGSKGDIIGQALLSGKDPVKVFTAILLRVAAFYAAAGEIVTEAKVRRYAIVWVNTLRKQDSKIYGKCLPGVVYSVQHRAAVK